MRILIVGGNIDHEKSSSIIAKLSHELIKENNKNCSISVFNGTIPKSSDLIKNSDLILWFPDISNDIEKEYPKKDKGSVLICSKVIRDDRTEVDAISRIFDMHGNAVIAIYPKDKIMKFKLIDALGNQWCQTYSIQLLANAITNFYKWSNDQIRIEYGYKQIDNTMIDPYKSYLPERFIKINTRIADEVENSLGSRYFGNFSTRCMSLFPSLRNGNIYLFSKRNTDKKRIGVDDFVFVEPPYYYSNSVRNKYSVDAPVQIQVYKKFPDINFMIHGHAIIYNKLTFIKSSETKEYYPCGDLRESIEINNLFNNKINYGERFINLKNHGFLLASKTLEELENIVDSLIFKANLILR